MPFDGVERHFGGGWQGPKPESIIGFVLRSFAKSLGIMICAFAASATASVIVDHSHSGPCSLMFRGNCDCLHVPTNAAQIISAIVFVAVCAWMIWRMAAKELRDL